jgi:hypothetical protein
MLQYVRGLFRLVLRQSLTNPARMKPTHSSLGRRDFLKLVGTATPLLLAGSAANIVAGSTAPKGSRKPFHPAHELAADLIIVGGGLGGCAAALAAARQGLRVIMTEETDWIGGQLTQQAVPPDENRWIETFGGTRSYQALRTGIRDYYRRNYPLTDKSKANQSFNPGNCWVSKIGAEMRVGLAVLHEMLAPYLGNGLVQILLHYRAIAAETQGDKVLAVQVRSDVSGRELALRAPFFVDATEQGDLLPLTGTEYLFGAESKSETGEPHAKDKPERDNVQGFTWCFAMDYLEGEDHTIARPRDYAYWRDFQLKYRHGTSHPMLTFDTEELRKHGFDPVARKGFWTYRRIADRDLFAPGFYDGDITIVNWPQNDYSFGLICETGGVEAKKHLQAGKQLSLSLLYWLQTEMPRPDGGTGWKGLRLRPDIVGTEDGLAKYPYIREGRRIKAEFTVLEQHVTSEARMAETSLDKKSVRATQFPDSVGIGSYWMDLHITTRGDQSKFGSTLPFQIPLGALLPQRVENLLPGCKNLGVTHLTNGCFRLHPVEWNIGESAGALAAFCLRQKCAPREVRAKEGLMADFQKLLRDDGVRLEWPAEAGAI